MSHLRLVSVTSEEELEATRETLPCQPGKPVMTLAPPPPPLPLPKMPWPKRATPRSASGRPLPLETDRWFRTLQTQGRNRAWVGLSKEMETACKRMRTAHKTGDERGVDMALAEFDALAWDALATPTLKFGDLRDRVRLIAHLLGCRDPIGSVHCGDANNFTPAEKMFAMLDFELSRVGSHCDLREGDRAEKARAKAMADRAQVRATANDNGRRL